jgi:hypothetical protein
MEVSLLQDKYMPVLDDTGNYVDSVPYCDISKAGMVCTCTGTVFYNKSSIKTHFKTIRHQSWLKEMNSNKYNIFIENDIAKELCEQQKKIIAGLQKEISRKDFEIKLLTEKLMDLQLDKATISRPAIDLLDM